jgi:hypothetical protein
MKILKWILISILSFILFLSLISFGLAYTIKATVLNPQFIPEEIDKLPLSTIENQFAGQEFQDLRPEVRTAINQTVKDMEPQLKQATGAAIAQVYDYLLGNKPNADLATTLRNTVLSNSFVDNLIDETPIATIASNIILDELNKQNIPKELLPVLNYIEPTFETFEPNIKTQIKNAAPPVIDYLLGKTKNFKVTINLQPVANSLTQTARQILLNNPPVEFAGIPPTQLAPYIDKYVNENIGVILFEVPTVISFDENQLIGNTETPSQIAETIKNIETQLSEIRYYVHLFQQYYIYFIVFVILLIGAIAASYRSVRGSTFNIGLIFVIAGIIDIISVIVGKTILHRTVLDISGIPAELVSYFQILGVDMLSPLQIFSLVVIGIGAVLIFISYIYKTAKKKNTSESV